MSDSYISAALRRRVATRASRRCEYCLIHENDTFWGCLVDHIISEKHGGKTHENNLAYCCAFCNRHKGSDIATRDSRRKLVPLFDPRNEVWSDHFRFRGTVIVGLTSVGRATARLLKFNEVARVEERKAMTRPV